MCSPLRRATAPPQRSTPAPKTGGATLIKGGAAVLARYMDESRSIPTATSFRTLTVTELEQRRQALKQAGQRVSFTHLIAYAIARVATEELPVMTHHFEEIDGKPHRVDDGGCNLGLAVDVERKDGSRTLMVPVIRDAGPPELRRVPRRLQRAGREGAHQHAHCRRSGRRERVADKPRRDRHDRVGPAADGRARGRSSQPARSRTRLASDGSAEAIGAEKVMTMTSTYDHRIIQGAESGRFLQRIEAYLRGEDGFYERVFGDLGLALPALPAPTGPAVPATAAAAPSGAPPRRRRRRPTRSCCRRCRPPPRCSRPTARTVISPLDSTRSAASRRATPRSIPSRSA